MLSKQQQIRTVLFGGASFILFIILYIQHRKVDIPSQFEHHGLSPRDQAGNATLGFQKILAVSPGPSWRTRGLEAAAAISQIKVSIPTQPYIANEFVTALQEMGATEKDIQTPASGSAKAWLAHLDIIKYTITSDFESVLIIEDDTDWDTNIRDQMMLVSDGVREYTATEDSDVSPYGLGWDVLWIGHGGEVTNEDTARVEYQDPTVLPTDLYVGWGGGFLRNLKEGHRSVQLSYATMCTFGYALSRVGAKNVLRELSEGKYEAFDVALKLKCQEKQLRCISLNPELMHHYQPSRENGYRSPIEESNGNLKSAAEDTFENVKGTTANLKHSARCAALYHDTCLEVAT